MTTQHQDKHAAAVSPDATDAPQIARRNLFRFGTACAVAALAGCDWLGAAENQVASTAEPGPNAGPTPSPPPAAPAPAPGAPPPTGGTPAPNAPLWSPTPTFVEGSQVPFDLASTLPAGILRGGVFSIDPAGAPLPAGMSLTSRGLLYAGTARVGTTTGVVFRYSEPS